MDFELIPIINALIITSAGTGVAYCLFKVLDLTGKVAILYSTLREMERGVVGNKNHCCNALEKINKELLEIKTAQVVQKSEVEKLKTVLTNQTETNQKKK